MGRLQPARRQGRSHTHVGLAAPLGTILLVADADAVRANLTGGAHGTAPARAPARLGAGVGPPRRTRGASGAPRPARRQRAGRAHTVLAAAARAGDRPARRCGLDHAIGRAAVACDGVRVVALLEPRSFHPVPAHHRRAHHHVRVDQPPSLQHHRHRAIALQDVAGQPIDAEEEGLSGQRVGQKDRDGLGPLRQRPRRIGERARGKGRHVSDQAGDLERRQPPAHVVMDRQRHARHIRLHPMALAAADAREGGKTDEDGQAEHRSSGGSGGHGGRPGSRAVRVAGGATRLPH